MSNEGSVSSRPTTVLWSTLRTDRWVQLVWGAFLVIGALYWLPVLTEDQRALLTRAIGPLVFLSLVLAALTQGLDRLTAGERRFWHDVIAAFSALLAVAALYLLFPRVEKPLALDLMVEALYAAYYAALVLAVELQPHRTYRWRPTRLERLLSWPAVIAFIVALFGYFTVVPILSGSATSERWLSSYSLYLALDGYLTARFLWLSRGAGSDRWRTLYLVLGLTTGTAFCATLLEVLLYQPWKSLDSAAVPIVWGAPLDLIYYLPYLMIVLSRGRHFPFRDQPAASVADERPETHFTRPSGRTMVHALAFPLIHLGGYQLNLFVDADRTARELLVFWAVVVLGSIAVIQHRVLERRARQLWHDREAVEASLRRNEKDLRMMVERYHTDQRIRLSEEKLAKAFRVCPDAMVIASFDGVIKEVNDSFERMSGYLREDILGKNVTEVGLWQDPEQRREMLRELELKGAIRDFENRFKIRSGQVLTGLISVEKLTIDGEPHLLSVTRDITERKRIEDKLKTQAVLLDRAQDAIAVLDLENRVTYWNRSAERLYGWSAAEALGRSAADLLRGDAPAIEASKRVDEQGDWIGELKQVTKDGAEIVVESWWTLVRDQDGNPQSKLVISSDAGRRQQVESAPLSA